MNREQMEQLRDVLNEMICSNDCDYNELVHKSQELDKLIVQAIKEKSKAEKKNNNVKPHNVIESIQFLAKICDSMRIVDPIEKQVTEFRKGKFSNIKSQCYYIWEKCEFCENCISIKSYKEDDAFFKIEDYKNKIYIVIAVPVTIKGTKFIVELLKDVTNNIDFKREEFEYNINLHTTTDHMNQSEIKDELTNLYNKKFIYEKLPSELSQCSLYNEPLSLIFADIDFFKEINDKYGQLAGNQILHKFAGRIQKHIRQKEDWAARYGADEFIICIPSTDAYAARLVAERIRKSIIEKEFIIGNENIYLTASFGVHTVCNEEECAPDNIIESVRKKLRRAKSQGKNKMVW